MAISAITRFVSIQTLVKNANVNSVVCTSYLATANHLNTRSKLSGTAWRGKEHMEESFDEESSSPQKPVFMSTQMRRYLDKAKAHEDFMNTQIAEYEIGLRHLANIMGVDVETIKKTGTKRHIQYLFPSGLYEKKARPILEHPTILFPAQKEAEFDYSGRPHHSFFYTRTPKYYKLLHDVGSWIKNLDRLEDKAIRNKSMPNAEERKMDIQLLIPIQKENLEKQLLETLTTKQYEYFLTTMERLIDHTFSKDAIAFITQYYKHKSEAKSAIKYNEVQFDKNRRPFVKITNCSRKSTRGEVTVYGDGTGKIEINGGDILHFREQHFREQIAFPLIFTEMGDKVDIVAEMRGGGPAGQAGAVRWGISRGLLSFVSPEMRLKMKLAGLLTKDPRKRERKKPGQEGARRKFTWKKR